jgi:hypothetical protein
MSEGEVQIRIHLKHLRSGEASTSHATMLRLRTCGGMAPASVPALFRARLARPASSTACAVAAATSCTLQELAAERKGRPPSPRHLWHSIE